MVKKIFYKNSIRLCHCVICFLFVLLSFNSQAQNNAAYQITIDLQTVRTKDQAVKVTVIPPKIMAKYATYVLPISNYGGYEKTTLTDWISDFEVKDTSNQALYYEYISNNGILIKNADQIESLTYWVKGAISNDITAQKTAADSCFIISSSGFYGYFQGLMNLPFEVCVQKSSTLYGATAMHTEIVNDSTDYFRTPNYQALFENPILYARPDTMRLQVGTSDIHIAVYSETGVIKARHLYYVLKPMLEGMQQFIGEMPTEDYHFVMYFSNQTKQTPESSIPKNLRSDFSPSLAINRSRPNRYGGLACASSSFYVLPEIKDARRLEKMVQRLAAHEFIHLLTPRCLHSQNAQAINEGNEASGFSKHLWLYEGVTEYLSLLALVQNDLISEEDFFEEIGKKIALEAHFPEMSLTKMSENIYKKKYQRSFNNIYYKGTLIAFLLDIQLHQLNAQQKLKNPTFGSLKALILALIEKYGTSQAFDDDTFIEEITELTHPKIGKFFENYVIGKKTPPYQDYFDQIGMEYFKTHIEQVGSYGNYWILPNYKLGKMQFNRVGKNVLGLHNNDVIQTVNGTEVRIANFEDFRSMLYYPKPNQNISLVVARKGKKMPLTLNANAGRYKRTKHHIFKPLSSVSPKATVLKQTLLGD